MAFFDGCTGTPNEAFTRQFEIIPEGTQVLATIKFVDLSAERNRYELIWKIISEDFKGQEVRQNIKAFDEKPETRKKAINMLMLIMKMFNVDTNISSAPSAMYLSSLIGKTAGIKIGYMSFDKDDGSMGETNFIREVHLVPGYEIKKGAHKLESALTRNSRKIEDNIPEDDIPF